MQKGKIYSVKEGHRLLNTTQTSVVIPTNEIIKNKNSDLRVLACISAISNVDNWLKQGDNSRYCSVNKLNNNLDNICKLLSLDRVMLMRRVRSMISLESEEFKTVKREFNNIKTSCIEINYSSGGFITIDSEILEKLVSTLSEKAFKLYVNLLWLCKDNEKNKFIERQLTQDYLLELIGLSKNSGKSIRRYEKELVDNNLVEIRTRREIEFSNDFNYSTPVTKKYYKIKNT